MSAQSCRCSTDQNAEKELNFGGQNPSVWYWHSMVNKFSGNSDSDHKTLWPHLTTLREPLQLAIGMVPEIDTTVVSQSSYMKVFTSGGSFQYICVVSWSGWFRTTLFRPPFISNLLWGAFRIAMIIQEMKIAEKKSKSTKISVQQMTHS